MFKRGFLLSKSASDTLWIQLWIQPVLVFQSLVANQRFAQTTVTHQSSIVLMETMETDMTERYLLTINEAFALMSCSRSAFFDLRQRDPEFPREIRLTPRAVRYRNADIINYIERRAEKPLTG